MTKATTSRFANRSFNTTVSCGIWHMGWADPRQIDSFDRYSWDMLRPNQLKLMPQSLEALDLYWG
jgi:hypothetical protein